MSDIDLLIRAVAEGPQGPHVGAFFDLDGTLIAGYSALAFLRRRMRRGEVAPDEVLAAIRDRIDFEHHGPDVEDLVRMGVKAESGRSADQFERWSKKVFAREIANLLYPDARALVQAHREAGHRLVITSSATSAQVRPIADDLGFDDIICTKIAVGADGKITGDVQGSICWGAAKAAQVADFAARNGIDLAESFAYCNGAEDAPTLAEVGHPVALNPDRSLAREARNRHWQSGRLRNPPKPGPIDWLRTVAGAGAFGGGVLAGAAFGLLARSRHKGANVAGMLAPNAALAAAGVGLKVIGQENVEKARPAVFTFNHQSQLDVIVLAAVLRRDFTAVAKKELAADPLFAPLGYMIDVAYVDRANNARAREELKPTVEALRGGRSLAIAPEGTRSPTDKLGRFKKGAFNIAMQAGVPIVPIVMRNCGELMRPHSLVITPGTVDVAVLAPVDTSSWNHDNLDQHIAEVRQMYLDTLAHWPAPIST